MKQLVVALGLLLATSSGALALCVGVPDGPSSGYVANGMQQSLCLNGEVATDTAYRNRQVQIDSTLMNLQIQQQRQQFLAQQNRAMQMLPVMPAPSWP
ncbi:hypothetical protein [Devosia sp.]|uniref:hypothetical protein n=1 Tax=Devosia sp. TaxID=1871048 RepID=UPI003A9420A6